MSLSGQHTFKYNPGFLTDQEVIESFLVRGAEFGRVLDWMRSAPFERGMTPDHLLLIAPRGAGKTTLVRRVLAEVRTVPEFASSWHAVFLGEESYTITSPAEFFLECLFHLQDQLGADEWSERYEMAKRSRDDDELLLACVSALNDFSRTNEKHLLLIVENLGAILRDQIGADAPLLLDQINSSGSLHLLATSTSSVTDDDDDSAWLSNFIRVPLDPLTPEECAVLWRALTGREAHARRIRPLQILTGGSPRLLRVLAEFMNTPSLHDLMSNLNHLIDQNTEYFKSQLDALPSTERKVFAGLLDLWDPSTAKEVSEVSRVNVNVASAMLARLTDRGAVIKEPGKGRTATYYAAERLFNIYYLMRRRSHPSSRVRALVQFMTGYYDREELVDTTALLVAEACSLAPAHRADYHSTFDAILAKMPAAVRNRILQQTPDEFLESLPSHFDRASPVDHLESEGLDRETSEQQPKGLTLVLSQAHEALQRDDLEHAESIIRNALVDFPDNADLWFRLSTLLIGRADTLTQSIEAARRAVELEPREALFHAYLGRALLKAERRLDAKEALQAAIDLDSDSALALSSLGALHSEDGDIAGALQFYERAYQVDANEATVVDYGSALLQLKRLDDAEELVREQVERHPHWRHARHLLGHVLYDLKKYKPLEKLLRRAVKRSDADWREWAELGEFLWRRGRTQEAHSAYENAIDRGPTSAFVYADYAALLVLLNNSERAVSIARRAVELEPSSYYSSVALASTLANNAEYREAEHYFRLAVEQRPSSYTWFHLGVCLAQQGRAAEAEKAMRAAMAADTQYRCTLPHRLAEVLTHLGKDNEADQILAESLSENSGCVCARVARGDIANRLGREVEARQHYEEALRLEPNSVETLTKLSVISTAEEAHNLLQRALSVAPNDPHVLLARAKREHTRGNLSQSFADLSSALTQQPGLTEARLALTKVLADQGRFKEALEEFAAAAELVKSRKDIVPLIVDAAVVLATRGQGEGVERALESAEVVLPLEPLYVALKFDRGEQMLVANEIREVAKDIQRQISDLRVVIRAS